jgi:hypothetical protein
MGGTAVASATLMGVTLAIAIIAVASAVLLFYFKKRKR